MAGIDDLFIQPLEHRKLLSVAAPTASAAPAAIHAPAIHAAATPAPVVDDHADGETNDGPDDGETNDDATEPTGGPDTDNIQDGPGNVDTGPDTNGQGGPGADHRALPRRRLPGLLPRGAG